MAVQFSNNAATNLSAAISASATSITVADASEFPTLSGSDYTYVTLSNLLETVVEVVKVTAISGNTLTVVRGQDNTTASAFASGDKCELRVTAALLNDVAEQADTNTEYTAGTNLSLSGTTFNLNTNLSGLGTISSGAITSSGRGTFDELTLTGSTDNLTFNEASGDWTINNAQQNNGITIFDGSAGVAINYNGATVAEFTGSGGMNLITGSLRVGGTAVIDSSREGSFATRAQFGGIDSAGNVAPSFNKTIVSGYGLIGNRATMYITSGGGVIQLGNGGIHNGDPGLTVGTSNANLGSGRSLSMNGTTVIDSSRNLSSIGTISSGAITSTGNMSLSNSNTGNNITISRTDAGTSAIFHVGSSTGYVGTTSNHPFHIRQNDQSVITIGTNQNVNIATGGLEIGGTTVIDSSRNVTANLLTVSDGGVHSDSTFKFLTTANAAQNIRTKSVFAGTSYGDTPPAGSFNATNTYELNGTTVIDSSRNLSNIGTISASGQVTADRFLSGIGSVASPAYKVGDPDSGFYDSGANMIGVALGGVLEYDFQPTKLNMKGNQLDNVGNLQVDVTSSNGVRVTGTDSVADAAFTTMLIDHNASGSDTTTADRAHTGLMIDMDSSATGGGTSHEHRLYGIKSSVKSTGDSDLIYSIYASAEAEQTAGQVTNLYGGYFQATGDVTGGTLSNSYGVHALNSVANASGTTITNNYALYGKTLVGAGQDSNVAAAIGVYGEVEIDPSGASTTLSSAQVFSAQFDNDSAGDVTITTGYLYYGNYAGTLPSTAYGVYIADAVRNYFGGTLTAGLGSTTAAAYGFNGDLNTGMYSPANHEVALVTNGANRLNINSSGAQVTGSITASGNFKIDGTTVIDSSRNLTNIGTITATGDINLNGGNLTRNAHNTGHLEGGHNNIGSTAAQSNPIFTIGSGYNPNSTTLGNMYGVGYAESGSASFLSGDLDAGTTGWGMYVASDGDARIFLNAQQGIINSTGQHYADGSLVWNAGNDGSGSGLDADTVDGVQAGSFLRSDATDTVTNGSILQFQSSTGNTRGYLQSTETNDAHFIIATSGGEDIAFRDGGVSGTSNFVIRGDGNTFTTNNHYVGGNTAWHAGNDGAGSGLDADLLDGTTWATLNKLVGGTSFDVDAGNLNGLRFWNGSGSYRISMSAHNASGAGRVSGETTSDYNMYFKMDGGTNRGFVFQSGTSNRAGIDAAGNIRTVANVDCSYLRADRIYSNNDGSSGYFYNDTSTRTAYSGGDFYIQSSVGNYYNYATNQYIGNDSGDNIYFRSNVMSGTGWAINGAGRLTTRDHRIEAGYHLQRLNHHSGHLEGSYNNVGANDARTNPIYTIGSSYNPASTTLSNMYGIGYTHTNASFITIAGSSGWGLYVAAEGYARVYLSGQSGSGHFTGNITAYASDRRLKTNIQTIDSALEKVTRIRGVEFDWVDDITSEYDFHPQQMHETGVIAQEIQAVIPDAVVEAPMNGNYTAKCGTDHKFLTVDKEKIVPLLIEAIKELKSEVDALKSQLEEKL